MSLYVRYSPLSTARFHPGFPFWPFQPLYYTPHGFAVGGNSALQSYDAIRQSGRAIEMA